MALRDLTHLAACRNNFDGYLALCYSLDETYGTVSWNLKDQDVSQYQVDNVSLKIMPDNYRQPYLPVRSVGDGNCLFNSASIAICEDERMAVELRLRTCFELALN